MKFKKIFATSTLCFLFIVLSTSFSLAAEKKVPWGGVDVNVVEKYAKEYGRPARTPYINTGQGDLLLFVFTVAGAAGGFIVGYNWRRLFSVKECHSREGGNLEI